MDVDKVAFTGWTEIGKLVMQMAAGSNMKRVSLELGGKAPNIVFADADVDAAVKGAITGNFFNQGNHAARARASSRRKYGRILSKLKDRAEKLVVGDPLGSENPMGAQVREEQCKKILGYIEKGKKEWQKLSRGRRCGPKGILYKAD